MSDTSWHDVAALVAGGVPKTPQSPSPRTVAYAPCFTSQQDYTNHFHRAAWYLPRLENVLDRVIFGTAAAFSRDSRPEHFCGSRAPIDHLADVTTPGRYAAELRDADLILIWSPLSADLKETLLALGKRTINVATDDCSAAEYGVYCRMHWTLMSKGIRRSYLAKSYDRFRRFAAEVWAAPLNCAAVFGTGPSVDRALEFDFSSCYTHICNSIVADRKLLKHIDPWIVSAADAVSHIGVSTYADRFRKDLVRHILSSKSYFMTTAGSGVGLALQYPELEPRMILCDQMGPFPNFNLLENWALPALDSVLNIHMLPVASTLFNKIYVLGCDGKDPDPTKNEDFWAHSTAAQYHDLVETGHMAHPTFDANRQRKTWVRYKTSVRDTLLVGESRYGKTYRALAPSFTPGLDVRFVTEWENGPRPIGAARKRTAEPSLS